MDTLPRTGIVVPGANRLDSVLSVAALRSIALAFETAGVLFSTGTLANRPTAGSPGRFYRVTGDVVDRLYWDVGDRWIQIGGDTPPADGPVNVPSLRTLGPGHLQGSPGDHGHGQSEIVGLQAALTAIQAEITSDSGFGKTTCVRIGSSINISTSPTTVLSINATANSEYILGSEIYSAEIDYNAVYTKVSGPSGASGTFGLSGASEGFTLGSWVGSSPSALAISGYIRTSTSSGAVTLSMYTNASIRSLSSDSFISLTRVA